MSCYFDFTIFKYALIFICALLYNGFLIAAVLYNLDYKNRIDWCSGIGFVVCITSLLYMTLFYKLVIKKLILTQHLQKSLIESKKIICLKSKLGIFQNYWTKWVFLVLLVLAIIIFVAVDSSSGQGRVVALLGLFSIIIISVLLTENPENINVQILLVGLILNYLVGISFHNWPLVSQVFYCIRSKMDYSQFLNQTLSYSLVSTLKKCHVFSTKYRIFYSFSSQIMMKSDHLSTSAAFHLIFYRWH